DGDGYGAFIDNVSITWATSFAQPSFTWSAEPGSTTGTQSGATYTVTPAAATNTYTVRSGATSCTSSVTIDRPGVSGYLSSSASPIDCGSPVTLNVTGEGSPTYTWYSNSGCTTVLQNGASYTPNVNTPSTIYGRASVSVDGIGPYSSSQVGNPYNFGYTGGIQSVVVPAEATVAKLQVWGAQGGRGMANGSLDAYGGKGGYSYVDVNVSPGQTLYVVVGGKGADGSYQSNSSGGYNGGGSGTWDNGDDESSGGGGGATHIALSAGLLSSLAGNRSSVLVVAGGGGGGSYTQNGGYGGGTSGGQGANSGGAGGTQNPSTYFGQGQNGSGKGNSNGVAGGGGGWDGGRTNTDTNADKNSGGGGSGYITENKIEGNTQNGGSAFPAPGGSTETGHEGNGYARITFYKRAAGTCPSNVVSVSVNKPSVSITTGLANKTVCEGSSVSFSPTVSGPGLSYQWQHNGSSIGGNSVTYTDASASTSDAGTYSVTVTSTVGTCTAKQNTSATLTVNTKPTAPTGISGDPSLTICSGNAVTLSATGGDNGSGADLQWGKGMTVGSNILGTGTTYRVTPTSNDRTYWVRRVGTSACTDNTGGVSQTVTLNTAPTAPTSISGSDAVCSGSYVDLSASGGDNGSGATYQWGTGTTVGSNIISGQTSSSIRVTPTGSSTTYWVRRVGNSACTGNTNGVTKAVTVNTAPTAPTSISGTTPICSGSSTTLTANGGGEGSGATYQWGTGTTVGSNTISGSGASVTVSPDANTTYWVRRIGNSACTNTTGGATQLVTVNTAPTAPTSISGSNICLGNNTELSVLGGSEGDGSTYQWGTGTTVGENTLSGNTSTITVTPTETTTYWVRRVGNTACVNNTDGVTKQITVNTPNPSASGTYDYIWRGGSTNWNTASNWYMYSGGNYSVASSIPATAKNYYIGTGDCLPSGQWPSLSANATVGNVTIAGGSVTIPANKTLSIAGSINGTLTAQDNSTIAFVGSDDQTLSDAATFDNITIAQTATGKKIIAPNGITVNGLATFGTGVLSGDVSFAGSASATGASFTSYIDGTVTKTLGSAAFTFPLGSNGVLGEVYVPATRSGGTVSMHFNKSASADGFDVENDGYPRFWNINDMCAEDGANRFHHVSNAEYWDISSTAVVSGLNFRSIATSDIHFNDTSINQRDVEAIKFALYDGCWKNMGGTATVSGDYYELAVNGVTI
ncbi:MAG: hypothetical protein II575_14570, partial [Bacteroidales bacterium]|nr:hypothetical protein [Bacteroidales bacterium]